MKKIVVSIVMLFCAAALFAATPAENLVQKHKDVKGARDLVAGKTLLRMVRPMMEDHQIAPVAHKVERLSVLRLEKASLESRNKFVSDLKKMVSQYTYAGQSVTKNGIVDVYVHMASQNIADELVIYNPEICTLYSLSGDFTREELEKIQKKP